MRKEEKKVVKLFEIDGWHWRTCSTHWSLDWVCWETQKMQHTKASMRNAIAPASQNNCDSSCKTLSHQLQRIVSAGHIFLWSKVSRNSHQGLGPDLKSLVHVSVDCGQMIKNYKEVEGGKAGQQGSKQRYFVVVFSCRFCGCATRKQRSGSSVVAHWKGYHT